MKNMKNFLRLLLPSFLLFVSACQSTNTPEKEKWQMEVVGAKTYCPAGALLKEEHLAPVTISLQSGRASIGIPWEKRHTVTGCKLKRDLYEGYPIRWSDLDLKHTAN